MSSSVDNNKITLTRGDTLRVKISMKKGEEPYEPVAGDSLRFALKHPDLTTDKGNFKDVEPLILKDIPTSSLVLTLNPEDTKNLKFGKYVYDIELTMADGAVDTFITAAPFILTEEVH